MVSNYKRKPSKYKEEDVNKALAEYRAGRMSLRGAAINFKIDKSFLSRRLHKGGIKKRCRKQVLSAAVEQKLADCLKTLGKWGFGLSKEDAKELVKEYVQETGLETPFTVDKPGDIWFKNFQKRNNLSLKKPEQLETSRRNATSDPFIVNEFYDLVEEVVNQYHLHDKPSQIYNLDESGFSSDPSRVKVVAQKGEKVHRNIQGSGKDNTTVLACVNASGKVLAPLIIFQGTNLWSSWKGTNDLPGTFYSVSEKGWMTTSIFNEYFSRFCALVKERPILLILDGHLTHLDPMTIKKAIEENIVILKLPSHTTDVLQPLDKCCFRPLKLEWDKALIKWQLENQRKLTKSEFVDLLCEVWHKGLKPETIISGFISTGIYPVNRSKYPQTRFDPEKLERYNKEKNAQNEETPVQNPPNKIPAPPDGVPNPSSEVSFPSDEIPDPSREVPGPSDGVLGPSNVVHGPQSGPSVAPDPGSGPLKYLQNTESHPSCSFENLLLKKIKKSNVPSAPRRKVDTRAKIVTSEEFLKSIKSKVDQKLAIENKKIEKRKQKMEKQKEKLKPKLITKSIIDSSDESKASWEASGDSDGGDDFIGPSYEATEIYTVETIGELKDGDFILAEFKGGKRNKSRYKYVCIVQNIIGEEINVMAMNAIDTSHTIFKTNEEDVSSIDFESVIGKLPTPGITISGERVKYTFKNPVDVREY